MRPSCLEASEASSGSSIPQKIIDAVIPVGTSDKSRVLTDALLRGELPEPHLYGAERAALAASMATLQRQASIGIF